MTRSLAEWIARNDDTAIPPRVVERIARNANNCCVRCTRETGPALPGECDHIIPLILGGQHRESNLQWLCEECHAIKTRRDVKIKAKVARVRKKELGLASPRKRIQSRGFARFPPQRSATRAVVRKNA